MYFAWGWCKEECNFSQKSKISKNHENFAEHGSSVEWLFNKSVKIIKKKLDLKKDGYFERALKEYECMGLPNLTGTALSIYSSTH